MSEADTIVAEYARRARELPSDRYAAAAPAQVFARQTRERIVLDLLREIGQLPLDERRVLDVGCGTGQWLVDFETWGADRSRLAGIDLIEARVERARGRLGSTGGAPAADIRRGDASVLPWEDGAFELVVQSMVFSSIPAAPMRRAVAAEMARVLAPGGVIVWSDFLVGNPRNPRVRGVGRSELRALFPSFVIRGRRALLPPPLARTLVPISRLAADLLQSTRLVNSQFLAVLTRRPEQQ